MSFLIDRFIDSNPDNQEPDRMRPYKQFGVPQQSNKANKSNQSNKLARSHQPNQLNQSRQVNQVASDKFNQPRQPLPAPVNQNQRPLQAHQPYKARDQYPVFQTQEQRHPIRAIRKINNNQFYDDYDTDVDIGFDAPDAVYERQHIPRNTRNINDRQIRHNHPHARDNHRNRRTNVPNKFSACNNYAACQPCKIEPVRIRVPKCPIAPVCPPAPVCPIAPVMPENPVCPSCPQISCFPCQEERPRVRNFNYRSRPANVHKTNFRDINKQ